MHRTLLVLALSLCGASSAPAAPMDGTLDVHRAVEAFVSPATLFPVEGTSFSVGGKLVGPQAYRSLPAYDTPGGAQVGQVEIANVRCLSTPAAKACENGLEWFLVLRSGSRHRLPVAEHSYETAGLVTYQPSRLVDGRSWSAIEYAGGQFWVATEPGEVITYESRVHLVEDFDTWCTAPDRCAPVTASMSAEVLRVLEGDYQPEGCAPASYAVTGIVAGRRERYYQVELAGFEGRKPNLPAKGFIPTRTRRGTHSGAFYPRGC